MACLSSCYKVLTSSVVMLRMYNLADMKKENRNIVHQTEKWANIHIPLKECEKIYTDMRAMPYIHDHTSYEWKEAQN